MHPATWFLLAIVLAVLTFRFLMQLTDRSKIKKDREKAKKDWRLLNVARDVKAAFSGLKWTKHQGIFLFFEEKDYLAAHARFVETDPKIGSRILVSLEPGCYWMFSEKPLFGIDSIAQFTDLICKLGNVSSPLEAAELMAQLKDLLRNQEVEDVKLPSETIKPRPMKELSDYLQARYKEHFVRLKYPLD